MMMEIEIQHCHAGIIQHNIHVHVQLYSIHNPYINTFVYRRLRSETRENKETTPNCLKPNVK